VSSAGSITKTKTFENFSDPGVSKKWICYKSGFKSQTMIELKDENGFATYI
jgi:hypothetical protein